MVSPSIGWVHTRKPKLTAVEVGHESRVCSKRRHRDRVVHPKRVRGRYLTHDDGGTRRYCHRPYLPLFPGPSGAPVWTKRHFFRPSFPPSMNWKSRLPLSSTRNTPTILPETVTNKIPQGSCHQFSSRDFGVVKVGTRTEKDCYTDLYKEKK